jgi:hypothetical protein
VAAVALHFGAQIGETLDENAFMLAVPFVVLGSVSGVVLAWRRVKRGERPKTGPTVAHAASLLLGLVLMLEGVFNVWGPTTLTR